MDQPGLRLPTTRKVWQELRLAFIQESQIRAVYWQSGFGSIWASGKISERNIRMTQARDAKSRLKVDRVRG